MIKRLMVIAVFVFIGACASTGTEAPAPTAAASTASVDSAATADASSAPAADVAAPDEADLPQTASVESDYDPDEMVCRRERETGSNFYRRICRTRAEIEAREQQDQDIMRTGRKIQTGGSCALNGDC